MMTTPVYSPHSDAGWSSLVARRAHNPKVVGSNPAPATSFTLLIKNRKLESKGSGFFYPHTKALVHSQYLGLPQPVL
jgi:hypothetical protein